MAGGEERGGRGAGAGGKEGGEEGGRSGTNGGQGANEDHSDRSAIRRNSPGTRSYCTLSLSFSLSLVFANEDSFFRRRRYTTQYGVIAAAAVATAATAAPLAPSLLFRAGDLERTADARRDSYNPHWSRNNRGKEQLLRAIVLTPTPPSITPGAGPACPSLLPNVTPRTSPPTVASAPIRSLGRPLGRAHHRPSGTVGRRGSRRSEPTRLEILGISYRKRRRRAAVGGTIVGVGPVTWSPTGLRGPRREIARRDLSINPTADGSVFPPRSDRFSSTRVPRRSSIPWAR